MTITEEELIEACKRQEPLAQKQLYQQYAPKLIGLANRSRGCLPRWFRESPYKDIVFQRRQFHLHMDAYDNGSYSPQCIAGQVRETEIHTGDA